MALIAHWQSKHGARHISICGPSALLVNIMAPKRWKWRLRQGSSDICRSFLDNLYAKGRLPSEVIFHQRLSSIKGCLPSMAISYQRSSSIKGRLPSKVVIRVRSSSIKGCFLIIKGHLPSKAFLHQRLFTIKGRLPSKVVFRQRSSSSTLTVTPQLSRKWINQL